MALAVAVIMVGFYFAVKENKEEPTGLSPEEFLESYEERNKEWTPLEGKDKG